MQFTFVAQRRIPQRGPPFQPFCLSLEPQFFTLADVVPLALGEETLVSSPS